MSRKQLPYFPLGSVRKKKSWVEYLEDFADEMAGVMEKAMQKGGDRSI